MAHGGKVNPRMLLVIDLDLSVTAEDLFNHFNKAGEVIWTRIRREEWSSTPRGEAYVSFAEPQFADNAIALLDCSELKGKVIHVAKSCFTFNQVYVEISDEDLQPDEVFAQMFADFGPIIWLKQFEHQAGERYLVLTFENHKGAAKAATALEKRKFLDKGMSLCQVALVDPEQEKDQAAKKFFPLVDKLKHGVMPKVDEAEDS